MAPSSSPSPSKKLLIIDPNPKSKPNPSPSAAPLNSASSSSTTTTMPPPEKRTRDQPNLSDCHCCGRRINHTNPKDRLQPLDSVWRIVLLCRKCRKNVHSGQTCPYCFRETGNSGDLLKCNVCDRRIHKVCVKNYANCTPWCYLGVGLGEFRACVDCWVPELLKNSITVCGRSESKGGVKDKGAAKDLLGKVKDGKCEGEKKVKMVTKTKEQALSRAIVAKNAVDSLDKKAENSKCSGAIEVVDDAELAIQLHRAMNSSPRISRSKGLNSSALGVSNIRDWDGLFYKRSRLRKKHGEGQKLGTSANTVENERMNQPGEDGSSIDVNGLTRRLLPYKRDKKRKIWQLNDDNTMACNSSSSQPAELEFNSHSDNADILETAFCVNGDQINTRSNVDRFGHELIMYKRTRFDQSNTRNNVDRFGQEPIMYKRNRQKVRQVNGPCDNNRVVRKFENIQPYDAKNRIDYLHKCDDGVLLPIGSCDVERDRYRLKYCRRVMGTKLGSNCLYSDTFVSDNQASALGLSNSETVYALKSDGEFILPNGTKNKDHDRYSFKYVRRVKGSKSDSNFDSKVISNAFLNENGKSAPGLTVNCSAESRTVSDVSFDSFTTDRPE
ncbi:hypothetical protein BUALT_Bualt19G0090400 [Buddleja alternifolia]|uniref:Uncharacterized protein n=1 Tax=Buddleja alternifolia TaxID=168488 RepID=A0AAV6W2Z1_9LAMI|nr:hypothetical protein BUALT_Bualt19G0090400 [Buddleja alternifolia]